jgi:hypothetical protein
MGRDALIRIERSNLEDGSIEGYVVALGPDFFLMEVIDDSIRMDGHYCLRYQDITDCENPCSRMGFVENVLQLRGIERAEKPEVDLSSIEAIVQSVGTSQSIITIHPEETDPGTCFIGKYGGMENGFLSLLELTTDGKWSEEPGKYAIEEITRVDFGGAYEGALLLVANAG